MELQKEYEQVKKYAKKAETKNIRYDINIYQMLAIHNCSTDSFEKIFISFNYGFEKGRRSVQKSKTKK